MMFVMAGGTIGVTADRLHRDLLDLAACHE